MLQCLIKEVKKYIHVNLLVYSLIFLDLPIFIYNILLCEIAWQQPILSLFNVFFVP